MSEVVDVPVKQETTVEINPQPATMEVESKAVDTMKALEVIPDLIAELEKDNSRYDLHVKLINSLKLVDLPEQLESARMNMHAVFPLTEDLWLDWINDVKPEATTVEGRAKLIQLYKSAQEDYFCINVWKSYVEFVLEQFHAQFDESITSETSEITDIIVLTRNDLLTAVAATKFDVKNSQLIWKPYSEFELEVLNRFNDPEQLKRVKSMYLDRLAVLHIDCEETFNAYSSFVTAHDNTHYESNMVESNKIYAKTKRAAEGRDIFELKLVSSNYSLDSFYEYIENEKVSKSMSSLNNVRNLYERAIVLYCVDPTLWDDYILYLIEKGRTNAFLEAVSKRALRNCPWSGLLYAHRARLLESEQADNDAVINVFHTGLSNKQLLASGEDLVTLLLGKIDFERRKIDWEDPEEDQIIDLKVAFEESLEYLKEAFGKHGDPYYRVEKYYAFMSAKRMADEDKARELWESVVENHGRDTEAWIHYITFERDQGNYQKCESLFKKAHQKNVDNPSRLLDVWISMEREFGTIESFEYASIRINHAVKKYSRNWQAELAAQVELNEAKEKEKKENEKRKKGLHRMEQKKKQKEKKAIHKDSKEPSEFKEPAKFKKPAPSAKPFKPAAPVEETTSDEIKVIKSESPIADEATSQANEPESVDEPRSLKRKASDSEIKEEDAKKHKTSEETQRAPRPIKPFAPRPRATRGLKATRGKSLKLTGTRVLNKNDATEKTDTTTENSTQPKEGNTNDHFRDLMLGKK